MAQIMHKASQDNISMIVLVERKRVCGQTRNVKLLMSSLESIHLELTKVCNTTAVLKSIMRCSRENVVIRAKLENIFQPLHCWLIDERPAIIW